MGNQIQLNYLKEKQKDLESEINIIKQEIEVTIDPVSKQSLERKLSLRASEIDKLDKEIEDVESKLQKESALASSKKLTDILVAQSDFWPTIEEAYTTTLDHWPGWSNRDVVSTAQGIVSSLKKIPSGQSFYSATDEFVIHLMDSATDDGLINGLSEWMNRYRDNLDWSHLKSHIQRLKEQADEQAQPALLIYVDQAQLESAQSQDEFYYALRAWLVRDVQTYRQQGRGYHSLIQVDTPDSEPCTFRALTGKTTRLLNEFLEAKNRICRNCLHDPEVHIFLPMELMYSAVDAWRLSDSQHRDLLGQDYIVVVHCVERYQNSYRRRGAWLRRWKQHQALLNKFASDVFTSGCDTDFEKLKDILDSALETEHVVGLKLTQVPTSNSGDLFYELLQSTLPLAIWARFDLDQDSIESALDDVLTSDCLEQLPQTVRKMRSRGRRTQNKPDSYIGHHLSLLWDDPYLDIPRQSA